MLTLPDNMSRPLSIRAKAMVFEDAGAFSETLIESELFGHERGAFTAANSAEAGRFEAADGGTLFLDEIGDLPLLLEVKLLRELHEGESVRPGSRTPVRVDVRLIAATNVDERRLGRIGMQLEAAAEAALLAHCTALSAKKRRRRIGPLRHRPSTAPNLSTGYRYHAAIDTRS